MLNFVQVVQNWLGTNKFVRTKSHTGSTFSKIFVAVVHLRDCSCAVHPYYGFSLRCQVVPQQNAQFKTVFFGQFCSILRKDSIAKNLSEEMQTLRTGCSKAEPKIFTPPQTSFLGARGGQNLISWRWSLPLPTNPVW